MTRGMKRVLASAVAALSLAAVSATTHAQSVAPGIDAGRDCQTIRRCNFTKVGTFRGCISAYSCRTCRIDRANCTFDAGTGRKSCSALTCSWGS